MELPEHIDAISEIDRRLAGKQFNANKGLVGARFKGSRDKTEDGLDTRRCPVPSVRAAPICLIAVDSALLPSEVRSREDNPFDVRSPPFRPIAIGIRLLVPEESLFREECAKRLVDFPAGKPVVSLRRDVASVGRVVVELCGKRNGRRAEEEEGMKEGEAANHGETHAKQCRQYQGRERAISSRNEGGGG